MLDILQEGLIVAISALVPPLDSTLKKSFDRKESRFTFHYSSFYGQESSLVPVQFLDCEI